MERGTDTLKAEVPPHRDVSKLSVELRRVMPDWITRKLIAKKSIRSLRHKFDIYAAIDAPYSQLSPPPCKAGETAGPPDFVGIGAQRAGTSWWFDLITRHPSVYHRPYAEIGKERHFFSHYPPLPFTADDAELYGRWFPKTESMITGEWTPGYLYYAWVPFMLQQAAPDTRILVMLRDPVERFASGINHVRRINEGALPDGDIFQNAFDRGRYGAQLESWLKYFSKEQILVLQYEQCVATPESELARTFEFLGIDDSVEVGSVNQVRNASSGSRASLPVEAKERLSSLYADDVALLETLIPSLDLSLWANFAKS